MHSQEDRALRQLWGLERAPTRGPKARWSLHDVAAAGVALADEIGLAGVSVARVAERLDMTTTAIYRYVDAKATLIELMVDAAIGDPPTLAGVDWQARSRAWVAALAAAYTQHPWLAEVRPARMPTQPRAYAWIDRLVGAIRDDVRDDPVRIALLLDSLTRAYAALENSLGGATAPPWMADEVSARFPALAGAGRGEAPDARAERDFAVEVVLRGIAPAT